jgi:hypothetical protein
MGLGDEYSRDALFRRPDQEVHSDSDREESPDPLDPEDWEAMFSDEIYSDVTKIQEFVYDGCHRVKKRYGVAEYTKLLHEPHLFWSDCVISQAVMSLWRKMIFKNMFDPQSFQTWLKYYIELN